MLEDEADQLCLHWIPKRALFEWFCNLSFELAHKKQSRLPSEELLILVNHLRKDGFWNSVPEGLLSFGQHFGLTGFAKAEQVFVFPIAFVLSRKSQFTINTMELALQGIVDDELPNITPDYSPNDALENLFFDIPPRTRLVVEAREGLSTGKGLTLEETANVLPSEHKLTRERIRQIEAKFWRSMLHPVRIHHALSILLRDIMQHHGSLVQHSSSSEFISRIFLAKCVNIPVALFPHTKLTVIGLNTEALSVFQPCDWYRGEIDPQAIAFKIQSLEDLTLLASDIDMIAEEIFGYSMSHQKKSEKVIVVLQKIGKPSHFSEVAKVYREMFPDEQITDHSIHALLGREEHGIVWIGMRGTYALSEWGYERPSKGLFDSVAEIVSNLYNQNGQPVPMQTIITEMGKYRKIARLSSIIVATTCNQGIVSVGNNCFVPQESVKDKQIYDYSSNMDLLLRDFEKSKNQLQ